jgi:hypothetical protein
MRLTTRVLVLAVVVLAGWAAPVAADPPRPTDFRTDVVAIDPPVDGVRVRLLGGDAFLEISVDRGHEVVVTGYRGEPFVRYLADGTVEEDLASVTSRTSQTRYGSDLAAEAGGEARWTVVARNGSWAWHDHRAHWMSPQDPPGRGPGDQVLEGVVPLTVDGRAVKVQLATWWVAPPPTGHTVLGLAAGFAVAAMLFLAARRAGAGASLAAVAVLGVASVAALAVGLATRVGLPAAAAPGPLHWVLPALACATVAGASAVRRRPDLVAPATVLGALSLLQWAWWRRDVLDKPVLPTAAPFALDRFVTAAVVPAAGVALVVAALAVARALRGAPSPPASTPASMPPAVATVDR